jgi:hypothetical protein
MSAIELDDVLGFVRGPATDRMHLLMNRLKPSALTAQEILALVAVFEAADQRANAPAAPVLRLLPT